MTDDEEDAGRRTKDKGRRKEDGGWRTAEGDGKWKTENRGKRMEEVGRKKGWKTKNKIGADLNYNI